MAFLELRELRRTFGPVQAVRDVSLSLERGRVLVLLGPSGCGKTTLLRLVAGLERPDSGSVFLDGRDITPLPPHRRDIAMVFQNYALYPHMTARANMEFGLRIAGLPRDERESRVRETAEMLGIGHLLDRRPARCSGGERQRIALGRAIVRRPNLFLFDEPLSNLDASLRDSLRLELRTLLCNLGATAVYVTHDQSEAMFLGDTVAVMNAGRVEQVGTPKEVYDDPASLFVALFLGSPRANVFRGFCRRGIFTTSGGAGVPAPALPDGPAVLVLRPHSLRPSSEGPFRGRLLSFEYQGERSVLWFDSADGPLAALSPADVTPAMGDEVFLTFPAGAALWFDASTGRRLPAVQEAKK